MDQSQCDWSKVIPAGWQHCQALAVLRSNRFDVSVN
jgi:hypothetical protein